jgi:hypothetical protein
VLSHLRVSTQKAAWLLYRRSRRCQRRSPPLRNALILERAASELRAISASASASVLACFAAFSQSCRSSLSLMRTRRADATSRCVSCREFCPGWRLSTGEPRATLTLRAGSCERLCHSWGERHALFGAQECGQTGGEWNADQVKCVKLFKGSMSGRTTCESELQWNQPITLGNSSPHR